MTIYKKMARYCNENEKSCFSVDANKKNNITVISILIPKDISLLEQLKEVDRIMEGTKKLLKFYYEGDR